MRPNRLTVAWRRLRWLVQHRLNRLRTGWRYAWETMTENDAHDLVYDCTIFSGRYSLEELDRQSVLEQCRERFGDHPELAQVVTDACERTWSKWDSSGDLTGAAEDWAMRLVQEYAADRGITLKDSWDPHAEEEETEEQEA